MAFERELYFCFEAYVEFEDIALDIGNSYSSCDLNLFEIGRNNMIRLVNERFLYSDFEFYLHIECADTAVGNNNNPCRFYLFQNKRSEMISLTSEETIILFEQR